MEGGRKLVRLKRLLVESRDQINQQPPWEGKVGKVKGAALPPCYCDLLKSFQWTSFLKWGK